MTGHVQGVRSSRSTMHPRDRVAAALLYVCAVGAVTAALVATTQVADADRATRGVEAWRLIGLLAFAGLFVLLARAPRQLRGLWEVTIAAKAALPLAALTFARDSDDAVSFLVVDGVLVVALLTAYVLSSGWNAVPPRHPRIPPPGP